MEGKITQQYKGKKIFMVLVIMACLGFGTYWHIENEDFLANQKLAYISDLYLPIFFRELGELAPFLTASSAGVSQEQAENGQKTGTAGSVPVLVYHGVVTERQEGNTLLRDFRDHMFALKNAGWETISSEEFEAFMKGEQELAEKSFLLTFDDGRKDSYYPVDPILRALDYKAVMFVITNQSLGEKGEASHFYLSEKELQQMQSTGRWDIQSHGKRAHELYAIGPNGEQGHFYSNLLWIPEEQRQETEEEFRERIYEDLRVSKEGLEELVGVPVTTFAFPFGDYGQNLREDSNFELAKDMLLLGAQEHYSYVFYQWWDGEGFTQIYRDSDGLLLKRIEVKEDWSGEDLVAMLERGKAKSLPYTDNLSEGQNWSSTWGSFDIQGDDLVLRANEGETGASVILDGSGAWEDYEVTAEVYSPTQTGVFIWVRFQDADNNAACNFGEDFVHIEQVSEGEKRVIQGVRNISPIQEGDFVVGARVEGRTVQCFINDQLVVETPFLDTSLNRGGIGFKMWDEQVGQSSLGIKQVVVNPL